MPTESSRANEVPTKLDVLRVHAKALIDALPRPWTALEACRELAAELGMTEIDLERPRTNDVERFQAALTKVNESAWLSNNALAMAMRLLEAACDHPKEAWQHVEIAGDLSTQRLATWCTVCGALNTSTWHSPKLRAQEEKETRAGDRPPLTHVAIRLDGKVWALPSPARHHHVIRAIAHVLGEYEDLHAQGDDQGFLDASGRYLTRQQALVSAEANDQIKNGTIIGGVLTSEDLW